MLFFKLEFFIIILIISHLFTSRD